MKKKEREAQILRMLQKTGSVTVFDLSRMMDVSTVTIRSDLKDLEGDGVLLRTRGGAVLSNRLQRSTTLPRTANGGEKQAIARAARELIQADTWIFLGSGTTCLALAEELRDFPVNVMTNNLAVAGVLAPSSRGQVIMPGGTVFGSSNPPFLCGDLLHSSLGSVALSQAFLGVSGIDANFGYSLSNSVECSIFSRLRQISREVVILADASKFGKTSFMGAGPVSAADTIVTAGSVPKACLEWCSSAGVHVIRAEEEPQE